MSMTKEQIEKSLPYQIRDAVMLAVQRGEIDDRQADYLIYNREEGRKWLLKRWGFEKD